MKQTLVNYKEQFFKCSLKMTETILLNKIQNLYVM